MLKSYTITFSSGEALENLTMDGGNFYLPEGVEIDCSGPVTVSDGEKESVFAYAGLSDANGRRMLLFWNTDGKSWSFTLADGTVLEDLQRLPNGYFISQKPVENRMFAGAVTLSDGENEKALEGLEISQTLTVGDSFWFHLRDFGEEAYSVTLADGTTFENLRKNGGCYISRMPVDAAAFEDNCSQVILRGSGGDPLFDAEDNIHRNLELASLWEESGEWCFSFREIPPVELAARAELKLTRAQNQALSDRNEFLEDCIAEMAEIIYA